MTSLPTFFLDLDDTLYPSACGLWQAIRGRIGLYMEERMGFSAQHAASLRKEYYETYGTALRGLEIHHQLDPADFLAYVHDLPLRDYLRPDPYLRSVLQALPARKFIFTNADVAHAVRVTHILEIADCFDGVIDVVAVSPYCKPMPEAFLQAMRLAGQTDPGRCIMLDDMPRTTRVAKSLGMFSILVGAQPLSSAQDAHATLTHWSDLRNLLSAVPDFENLRFST